MIERLALTFIVKMRLLGLSHLSDNSLPLFLRYAIIEGRIIFAQTQHRYAVDNLDLCRLLYVVVGGYFIFIINHDNLRFLDFGSVYRHVSFRDKTEEAIYKCLDDCHIGSQCQL